MPKGSLLFDPSAHNELYTLDEVLRSVANDNVLRQERFKSLFTLASRQHRDQKPRAPKNNRRFFVQVWKDMSKVDATDSKVNLSFSLLEKYFYDLSLISLEDIKNMIPTCPNTYLMVSLFGMYSAKKCNEHESSNIRDHIFCVGTLLAAYCDNYLVITHVAVSTSCYSGTSFGTGSDEKSFRNRGIARVLVALAQAMYSTIHPTSNISTYFWSFWVDKKCFLKELGFQSFKDDQSLSWPQNLQSFIELHCSLDHQEMVEDSCRDALVLHGLAKGFEIVVENSAYRAEKEMHELFKDPFLAIPDTLAKPVDSLNEFDSTKLYFIQTICGGEPSHTLESKIIPDFFSMIQAKKASVMFLSGSSDINKELKTVTHGNLLVPQVAVDYVALLIMLMSENTICFNGNTVMTWYLTSFSEVFQTASTDDNLNEEWDSKAILAELQVISKNCDIPTYKMFFPFCYNGHWIIVERMWLSNRRVFFYADSDFETTTEVSSTNNNLIPQNVIWMFANTPLWPIGTDAYWIFVPNVQQLEMECGARVLLHAMLMASSASPHDSLLCLQNTSDSNRKIFNKLNRQWVNQVLKSKKLVSPKFFTKDKANFDFQYTPEWLETNGSRKCFDIDTYNLLTTEVRKGDIEVGWQVSIPIHCGTAIVSQEERVEIEQTTPSLFTGEAIVTQEATSDVAQPTNSERVEIAQTSPSLFTGEAFVTQESTSDAAQSTNSERVEIEQTSPSLLTGEAFVTQESTSDAAQPTNSGSTKEIVPDQIAAGDQEESKDDQEESQEDTSMSSSSSPGRAPWDTTNYDSDLQDSVNSVEVTPQRKHLRQLGICANCNRGFTDRKYSSCGSCGKNLHSRCGVISEANVQTSATLCYSCSIGLIRFKYSSLDRQIMACFGLSEEQFGTKVQPDIASQVLKMQLVTRNMKNVKSIRRKVHGASQYSYQGLTKSNKRFDIPVTVMEELLLYFFKDTLRRVNLAPKYEWVSLPPQVMEFFVQFGRAFGNNDLFDQLALVEDQEWRYLKFNTWNGKKLSKSYNYTMTDLPAESSLLGHCWLSLSNSILQTQVPFLPTFFYLKWLHTCDIDRDSNHPNEVEEIFERGKSNVGIWMEIDAGSSRYVGEGNSFRYKDRNLPKSFRIQPYGENSCIFNSLANAMHYINDWKARDMLIEAIPNSLRYDCYKNVATSRKKFAAFIVNFQVKKYNTTMMENFDILEHRSFWPTLCILKGSDNSANHAITVVENYIFDSNCPYAMQLTRDNLDWCCSSDDVSTDVKYVEVLFGYCFNMKNPAPNLVLRGSSKARLALKSVIMCFSHLREFMLATDLDDEICNIKPATDIFSTVRNIIMDHSKKENLQDGNEKGYWPQRINSFQDVISDVASPTTVQMLLIHIKGTNYYKVVSIVDFIIFDGTTRSIGFSLENLYSCICHSADTDSPSIESFFVVKGYRFVKRQVGWRHHKRLKYVKQV